MRLEKELDKIKCRVNEAERIKQLQQLCSDKEIVSDALEIAKNAATSHLPLFTYAIALLAVILNYARNELLLGFFFIFLFYIFYKYWHWTTIYYDLIKIRNIDIYKEHRPVITQSPPLGENFNTSAMTQRDKGKEWEWIIGIIFLIFTTYTISKDLVDENTLTILPFFDTNALSALVYAGIIDVIVIVCFLFVVKWK